MQREWAKEFAKFAKEGDLDPLPTIVDAFASSQFNILRKYEADLERVKKMLQQRKDRLFGLQMVGADRVILEYPLAR